MTRLQDIEKGKLFDFKAETPELTERGSQLVYRYLGDLNYYLPMNLLGKKHIDTVEIQGERLQGRLFTRIEQYLYKFYDVTLPEDVRQKLSQMIAHNTLGGDEMKYFDVVPFIRWKPGSFGEATTSCWWGSYKDGKADFQQEMRWGGAAAIRLFRPATEAELNTKGLKKWYKRFVGAGRCFALINQPENIDIVFNGYGLNYHQWATFLQNTLGYAHTKPISLYLGREIYVNNGGGEALSDIPIYIREHTDHYFGQYPKEQCKHCTVLCRNRDNVCEQCRQQLYQQISSGAWVLKEKAITIPYITYRYSRQRFETIDVLTCQEEIDNKRYIQCETCGGWRDGGFMSNCRACRQRERKTVTTAARLV